MAKTKLVTNATPSLPAVSAPAAPRLAVQVITAAGELLVIAMMVVGVVTVGGWLLNSNSSQRTYTRVAPSPPPTVQTCWIDRRHREHCEEAPQVRRRYVRG